MHGNATATCRREPWRRSAQSPGTRKMCTSAPTRKPSPDDTVAPRTGQSPRLASCCCSSPFQDRAAEHRVAALIDLEALPVSCQPRLDAGAADEALQALPCEASCLHTLLPGGSPHGHVPVDFREQRVLGRRRYHDALATMEGGLKLAESFPSPRLGRPCVGSSCWLRTFPLRFGDLAATVQAASRACHDLHEVDGLVATARLGDPLDRVLDVAESVGGEEAEQHLLGLGVLEGDLTHVLVLLRAELKRRADLYLEELPCSLPEDVLGEATRAAVACHSCGQQAARPRGLQVLQQEVREHLAAQRQQRQGC
mmetsp:Transcript_49289/g.127112  ORF Transcript_49289/g.127112 Transcript_49289/m.127112 type:complete len:311 (+) Transcript_49289:312-1244(+)